MRQCKFGLARDAAAAINERAGVEYVARRGKGDCGKEARKEGKAEEGDVEMSEWGQRRCRFKKVSVCVGRKEGHNCGAFAGDFRTFL